MVNGYHAGMNDIMPRESNPADNYTHNNNARLRIRPPPISLIIALPLFQK